MDLNYTKTLTGGGAGFRYEEKITALFALRLNNNYSDFFLASNFQKAGKFDDIVFTIQDEGEWKTWFIQLKHRQPSTLDKKKISKSALRSKGDLVLKQYFDSYKTTVKKFGQGDDPIFSKPFSQARFAIYTNAILANELAGTYHNVIDHKFLNTNPGLEQTIRFDLQKDHQTDGIFTKMRGDWFITDFVNRLFMFTRQANEEDLDVLIQSEIRSAVTGLKASELKLITYEWLQFIQSWASTERYLVKTEVQQNLKRLAKEAQQGKRNDVSIKFVDSFIKNEIDQLAKEQLVHWQSDVDNIIIAMAALEQMGFMNEPNLSLNLRSLAQKDDIDRIASWLKQKNVMMIVDCEGDILGVDIDEIGHFMRGLIDMNPTNKIILVSTKHNSTAQDVALQAKARRRKFNCTLKNLNEESREMLKAKYVEFQGYKTTLASLMTNRVNCLTLDDVFDMSAMTQLLLGRLVQVGIKPIEQIPYYVTRTLTRLCTVNQSFFTMPDVFAVYALSGISLDEARVVFKLEITTSTFVLSQHDYCIQEKIVILEGDPMHEFEELSKRVVLPLHWFDRSKRDGRLWQWKDSTSSLSDITSHLHNFRDYVSYHSSNIKAVSGKCVVITAEPGMGKSTLLVHMASETKKMSPHLWVICLSLNDYIEHFEREDFIRNIKVNTKNLIANAAGVDKGTTKFDARLFNQCYDVTGNLVILLDGFDEITPSYTQQGLAMIKALQDTCIERVWVSSRPVLRETLELATCTISYSINPFVLKDQRTFLRKFWKLQFPETDDIQLNKFVDRLLELVQNTFDQKLAQFTGIPLQTRMIAEVFTEELKCFIETGQLTLKKTVNGVKLFDDFVRIKRGVLMDKSKTIINANNRWELDLVNERREEDLRKLALLTLLPADVCETLEPPITAQAVKDLKELVNNGKEKSGLLLTFKGESPQFIHRTFAEYFVAVYFVKHFKSNKRFMSTDIFFSSPFEFVRYFFDNKLSAGCKLHQAVLNRDVQGLSCALEEGIDVNSRDEGGRTALHLAAAMTDAQAVIMALLQANAVIDIYDAVLEGTPIDYAVKMGNVENAALLGEEIEDFDMRCKAPISWSSLQMCVKGDYLHLFRNLIANGILEKEPFFDQSKHLTPHRWIDDRISSGLTILHIIAHFNASKIFQYLLSNEETQVILILMLEVKSDRGLTPLLQAAAMGNFNMVRSLMEIAADPLVSSPDGKNLASYAVESHDLDLLLEIISCANIRTFKLAEYLRAPMTSLVADKSEWAATAWNLIMDQYPELITLQTTKNTSLLIAAVIKGNDVCVKKLLDLGANVNEVTVLGSPLHYAVVGGHADTVQRLLDCPQIRVDDVDRERCTPLYKAASKGYEGIFQMLLGAGATLTIETVNGDDLTHAVADSCNESIFYYLIQHDYDFLKPNYKGITGFEKLKEKRAYSLVQALDPCFQVPVEEAPAVKSKSNSFRSKCKDVALPITKECSGKDPCPLENALKNLDISKSNTAHSQEPQSKGPQVELPPPLMSVDLPSLVQLPMKNPVAENGLQPRLGNASLNKTSPINPSRATSSNNPKPTTSPRKTGFENSQFNHQNNIQGSARGGSNGRGKQGNRGRSLSQSRLHINQNNSYSNIRTPSGYANNREPEQWHYQPEQNNPYQQGMNVQLGHTENRGQRGRGTYNHHRQYMGNVKQHSLNQQQNNSFGGGQQIRPNAQFQQHIQHGHTRNARHPSQGMQNNQRQPIRQNYQQKQERSYQNDHNVNRGHHQHNAVDRRFQQGNSGNMGQPPHGSQNCQPTRQNKQFGRQQSHPNETQGHYQNQNQSRADFHQPTLYPADSGQRVHRQHQPRRQRGRSESPNARGDQVEEVKESSCVLM